MLYRPIRRQGFINRCYTCTYIDIYFLMIYLKNFILFHFDVYFSIPLNRQPLLQKRTLHSNMDNSQCKITTCFNSYIHSINVRLLHVITVIYRLNVRLLHVYGSYPTVMSVIINIFLTVLIILFYDCLNCNN